MTDETQTQAPTAPAPDPYDSAELYDCSDSEEYEHEDPAACIAEYLDGLAERDEDVDAQIVRLCPITVTAYVRATADPRWTKRTAERLAEMVDESWCGEYGTHDGLDGVAKENLERALAEALSEWAAEQTPWSCVQVGTRTYSAEQVVAMMRVERPEWWPEAAP